MKYILISAVIVCKVTQTFCGIGLSGLLCKDQESIITEDEMQRGHQLHNESAEKKRSYFWVVFGLIIFVSWIITTIIITK